MFCVISKNNVLFYGLVLFLLHMTVHIILHIVLNYIWQYIILSGLRASKRLTLTLLLTPPPPRRKMEKITISRSLESVLLVAQSASPELWNSAWLASFALHCLNVCSCCNEFGGSSLSWSRAVALDWLAWVLTKGKPRNLPHGFSCAMG